MSNANIATARTFAIENLKGSKKRLDDDQGCNHAIRVSETLKGMGYDEDIVIAALLHDVVEDTETTELEILAAFGPEITRIVMAVTHDSSLNGKAQKEDLLRNVKEGGEKSIIVKLSDNCDNIRTIEHMKLRKVADYLDYAKQVQEMGIETFGEENELVKMHKQMLEKALTKVCGIAQDILNQMPVKRKKTQTTKAAKTFMVSRSDDGRILVSTEKISLVKCNGVWNAEAPSVDELSEIWNYLGDSDNPNAESLAFLHEAEAASSDNPNLLRAAFQAEW